METLYIVNTPWNGPRLNSLDLAVVDFDPVFRHHITQKNDFLNKESTLFQVTK